MEKTEMKVVRFSEENVIATSNPGDGFTSTPLQLKIYGGEGMLCGWFLGEDINDAQFYSDPFSTFNYEGGMFTFEEAVQLYSGQQNGELGTNLWFHCEGEKFYLCTDDSHHSN